MQRVSVVGISGAGKTTVGKAIADALHVHFVELDGIHHQAGWTELPAAEFQKRIEPIIAGEAWVIDGNYTGKGVLDLVWERADTVVWLDPPRSIATRRIAGRTLRRAATRQVLWNGNREPWFAFLDPRPERNMILWTATRFRHTKSKYEERTRDQRWSHLDIVRLREPVEVDRFLAELRSR